jgi:N-acyl-D-amino-acid deacylase
MRISIFILLLCSSLFISGSSATDPVYEYDILIVNGMVLDGTGNPWMYRDIAIKDDRIAAVGHLSNASAAIVINAAGHFVAPGFIDTHSHAASGLSDPDLSAARPLLAQGISTVIVNPDGSGATDLRRQQQRLEEHGMGVNAAQMVPHGSIREQVMGMDDRAPDAAELEEMLRITEEGMRAGAVGLSTGLFYAPASYAETDEVIRIAEVVKRYEGIHQSHIRDESSYSVGLINAVQEIIDITEATGITGIVSHIKALGPDVWGKSGEVTEMINRARYVKGLPLFADQYPYEASATGLMAALVPRWATAGGRQAFLDRLSEPETRGEIITGIEENLVRRGGAGRIVMRHVSFDSSLEGLSLEEISEEMGLTPALATLELLKDGAPGIVSFNMQPDDLKTFMVQPWVMTASDGGFVAKGDGVPHPRNYGSFPRRIREYTLDNEVTDLAFTIRSMTSLPASVYQLTGRGLLLPGYAADVVIFNPGTIRDNATFTDPHQLSSGIEWMIINGKTAIAAGEFTGGRHGKILKRGNTD